MYFFRQDQISTTRAGTPAYMSPQVIKREDYTLKADTWSLGVLFLEIITKKRSNILNIINPYGFEKLEPSTMEKDIRMAPIGSNENPMYKLLEFICRHMVVKEEKDRASVKEVIADDIFKEHYGEAKKTAEEWFQELPSGKKCTSSKVNYIIFLF